ncbi:Acetyl esterase [Bacillus thuringiensis serovar israelensis ATCC 35646]|nr:Acetyl esterase [Bacillus thuringiensis serovar israelensis ATCC 35646]
MTFLVSNPVSPLTCQKSHFIISVFFRDLNTNFLDSSYHYGKIEIKAPISEYLFPFSLQASLLQSLQ